MARQTGAEREKAAETLQRTSRELRKAKARVEELEQVVGHAIARAGAAAADQMRELQKLDHLAQEILGVADFLDALSRSMPPNWTIDAKGASRAVLLAELGKRLGDPGVTERAAPESYELF